MLSVFIIPSRGPRASGLLILASSFSVQVPLLLLACCNFYHYVIKKSLCRRCNLCLILNMLFWTFQLNEKRKICLWHKFLNIFDFLRRTYSYENRDGYQKSAWPWVGCPGFCSQQCQGCVCSPHNTSSASRLHLVSLGTVGFSWG